MVGQGTNIPAHVQSVYLSPLENATTRSEVDQILTRALAEELVSRKRFEVANALEGADAVLEGAVTQFVVAPLAFDEQGRATEYQITITARMIFLDRVEEAVLWENEGYVYKESYLVERSEAATYFDRERLAIEEAAGSFARTLLVDLLEGF